MSKPFKTIDEQIELLKSRGLYFIDEGKSKKFLLCNNYYNVINYYSKFFMIDTDKYIPGTTFEEISNVYYFDREIKKYFFQATIDIEKCLKSLIAYYFSKAHGENYAYLDIHNFKNNDITKTIKLISSISNTLQKKKNENRSNSIKHYVEHHHQVPLWVMINYLTFGQIVSFLELMLPEDSNKIAKTYSVFAMRALSLNPNEIRLYTKDIILYLQDIQEIRNISAHSNKFLGFKCRKNLSYIEELHSLYDIPANSPKQDVYNVFIAMRLFMSKGNFIIFNNTIRKRMRRLNKELQTIDCNKIIRVMGFPENWFERPKLID